MTSRRAAPLMATMRSPARSPARAAGVRSWTAATTTPATGDLAQAVMLEVRAVVLVGGIMLGWVELVESLHQVLKPGAHGEKRGDPSGRLGEEHQGLEVIGEHGGEHGANLKEGGRLTEPARGGMQGAPGHVNHDHARA